MTEPHPQDSETQFSGKRPKPSLSKRLVFIFMMSLMGGSLLFVLLTSRFGSEIAVGAINSFIYRTGGGPIVRADIQLDLWNLALEIENLNLDFPQRGSIDVKKITIGIRPIQFLYGKVNIREVIIDKPRINWNLMGPRKAVEPVSPPDDFDLPIDVVIELFELNGGEIVVRAGGDDPTELTNIRLASSYKKGKYEILLETGDGFLSTKSFRQKLYFITAKAIVENKQLSINSFKVFLPETHIDLAGNVNAEKPVKTDSHFNADFEFPLQAISNAISGAPPLKGTATLNTEFALVNGIPELQGKLLLKNVWIDVFNAEDAEIKFNVNKQQAVLDGSVLKFAKGTIAIEEGSIQFKEPYPVSIKLKLDNVELGHILDNVTDLHSKTFQYQTGTVQMSGTIWPLKLDGSADLAVRDHQTHTVGHHLRTANTLVESVKEGRVRVGLYCDKDRFQIRKGTAAFGNTIVDVGVVDFGFDNIFHMEYRSNQFDFKDVSPLLGMKMTGQGSLECIIHGPSDDPTINGHVDMDDFSINGFRFGKMKSDIYFYGTDLKFNHTDIKKGASEYHTEVEFDFAHTPTIMTYSFTTDRMYTSDLAKIVQSDPTVSSLFKGWFAGSGSLYGTMDSLSGEARLVFPEFSTSQQRFEKGVIHATVSNNDLNVDTFSFKLGDSELKATATLDDWNKLDGVFTVSNWQLADIDALRFLFAKSEGLVEGSGKLEGTFTDPHVSGVFSWRNVRMMDATLPDSEIHFELSSQFLDIDAKLFQKQIIGSALFQFDKANALDLTVDFEDATYDFAVRELLGLDVKRGRVSGKLEMHAPLNALDNAKGKANIEELTGQMASIDWKSSQPVNISYSQGLFEMDPIKLAGDGVALETRGSVDLKGRMDVSFSGNTDLRMLDGASKSIEQASGPVEFNISLNGEWGKPYLLGYLDFKTGTIKLANFDQAMKNINGKISINQSEWQAKNFTFKYGGGDVSVNGNFYYSPFADASPSFDLRLDLRNVAYQLDEGMVPIVSGQLRLSESTWPLKLTGKLEIDSLSYTKSIKWQKKLLLDNITETLRPRSHLLDPNQIPDVVFDVEIDANNTIRVHNNLADMRMVADLRLVGNNLAPGLLNTISADTGKIYFQWNEFDIVRFMVEFRDEKSIHPYFDIAAETLVTYIEDEEEKEVRILLQISGDLEDPEVLLSSDAGLSQTDLVSLLVFGQPASQFQGNSVAPGLNALSAITGVNDQIREQFKLDEFRLTTEYSNSGATAEGAIVPKLVIGKEIAEQIYLTYSTTLGNQQVQGDQTFEIKYRMKYFTISGDWSSDSVQQQGNFGADLKFHIDF